MARALRVAALGALLLGVAAAALGAQTWWGRPLSIDVFFLRVVARFGLESPMLLTQLRLLEPYGIRFHADELDDFSVAFARRRADRVAQDLEMLGSYDRASLSPDRRRSYDVMEWFLDARVAGRPFLFHDYPVNQLQGIQTALPDFMLNVHAIYDVQDAHDYVARLQKFARALDQASDAMRFRARQGVLPPRFVFDRVLEQVAALTAPAPTESPLVVRFRASLEDLDGLSQSERRALVESATRAVEQSVQPGYARLAAVLGQLRAEATDEDGVWKLPDGEAYYAWTLRQHTSSVLSADEIHELGLLETARIQSEIRSALAAESADGAGFREALHALEADDRFHYPEGEAGRQQLLADYQAIVDDAGARLPAYFGRLPRARVVVERVPAFMEEGSPEAYYRPPAMDGTRPGIFYANLREVAGVSRFGMRTLAYHEAVPGHHLQIALAFENDSLPLFRRLIPFTAFVEGWALYAERLAAEQGFHPTAYDRVGQLASALFRAVRLVVDTGIHARRWTREQAIDYMRANTALGEREIVAEVERYIVNPGQACAYMVGQLEILRLREHARRELREAFELRSFHDALLGGGSLPLVLLEPAIEQWLVEVERAG